MTALTDGYFLRDERQSGGFRFAPGATGVGRLETRAATCAHCNTVRILLPDKTRGALGLPLRTHPRGYCQKCDAYVCDYATCQAFCTPIVKLIELAQRRPDLPVLLRGPRGELLFDPAILDQRKVY